MQVKKSTIWRIPHDSTFCPRQRVRSSPKARSASEHGEVIISVRIHSKGWIVRLLYKQESNMINKMRWTKINTFTIWWMDYLSRRATHKWKITTMDGRGMDFYQALILISQLTTPINVNHHLVDNYKVDYLTRTTNNSQIKQRWIN